MGLEEKDGFIVDPEKQECLHGIYPVSDCYSCVVEKEDKKIAREDDKQDKEDQDKENEDKENDKSD